MSDPNDRLRDVSPESVRAYKRRLADKIRDAIAQADEQGRKDIAARLRAIHEAIVEDDAVHAGRGDGIERRG